MGAKRARCALDGRSPARALAPHLVNRRWLNYDEHPRVQDARLDLAEIARHRAMLAELLASNGGTHSISRAELKAAFSYMAAEKAEAIQLKGEHRED